MDNESEKYQAVCQQATKGLFEGYCIKPLGHDGFCSPVQADAQHCAHCEGEIVWAGQGYVHCDPNTTCIAFGGQELAKKPTMKDELAAIRERCIDEGLLPYDESLESPIICQLCSGAMDDHKNDCLLSYIPRLLKLIEEKDAEIAAKDDLLQGYNTVAPRVLRDSIDRNKENARLRAELDQLRSERERAIAVLAPSTPEASLEDACRQLKQAHLSEVGNVEALEAEVHRLMGRCGELEDLLKRVSDHIKECDARSLEVIQSEIAAALEKVEIDQ